MKPGIYPRITLSITVERLNLHKLFVAPTMFISDTVRITAKYLQECNLRCKRYCAQYPTYKRSACFQRCNRIIVSAKIFRPRLSNRRRDNKRKCKSFRTRRPTSAGEISIAGMFASLVLPLTRAHVFGLSLEQIHRSCNFLASIIECALK